MFKRRGITSYEHENTIEKICKFFKAEPVYISSKGKKLSSNEKWYFPDAKNALSDFEIEVVPAVTHLMEKIFKWNFNREKILVVKLNSFSLKNFHKIFFITEKNDLIDAITSEVFHIQ